MWAHVDGDGLDDAWLSRVKPPENQIPVAVPLDVLVARTGSVAIALTALQVHTAGVSFQLLVRLRPSAVGSAGVRWNALFWQPGPGAPGFLFGLELADGRRVSNVRLGEAPGDLVFPYRPRVRCWWSYGATSWGSRRRSRSSTPPSWPRPPAGPWRCGPGSRRGRWRRPSRHGRTCPRTAGSPAAEWTSSGSASASPPSCGAARTASACGWIRRAGSPSRTCRPCRPRYLAVEG